MKLHGTLADNLRAAYTSVLRHRDRPVYSDTIAYWEQLISHARVITRRNSSEEIVDLIRKLSLELVARIEDPYVSRSRGSIRAS